MVVIQSWSNLGGEWIRDLKYGIAIASTRTKMSATKTECVDGRVSGMGSADSRVVDGGVSL